MDKEKIRPLYSMLQGFLSQTQQTQQPNECIYIESIWNRYNQALSIIQKETGVELEIFKVQVQQDSFGRKGTAFVRIIEFRQALGGLIAFLHGKYFSDEPAPFAEIPSQVINASQQQNQSITVQMVLEIQSKIDEKIKEYEEGSKERNFLQKCKNSLSSITSWFSLITQIKKLAQESGLNIEEALRALGWI